MSELVNKALEAYQQGDYDSLATLANRVCNEEGNYEKGIELLGLGLIHDPFNVKLRATRGRKYIGAFNYPCAASDLSLASRLDPSDWEIWYYGGVAAYMAGEYEVCKKFHERSRALMLDLGVEGIPATIDWYWMACMKLGQREEAKAILDEYIYEGMPTEDGDYLSRTLLYKGVISPENFVEEQMKGSEGQSPERVEIYRLMLMYGLANYYHYNGQDDKANELCIEIANFPKYHNLFCWSQARTDLKDRGVEF